MNDTPVNSAPFNEALVPRTNTGTWFSDHLSELVPAIYGVEYPEDWATILTLMALVLDSAKNEIDVMPGKWDVTTAPRDRVAMLGAQFGFTVDPTKSIELQRDQIAQAVHAYKRRGTYRDINAALDLMGVECTITETRLQCLRLNQSGTLNQSRIAGRLYNEGVLLFESDSSFPAGFCQSIRNHTPAGIRIFTRSSN